MKDVGMGLGWVGKRDRGIDVKVREDGGTRRKCEKRGLMRFKYEQERSRNELAQDEVGTPETGRQEGQGSRCWMMASALLHTLSRTWKRASQRIDLGHAWHARWAASVLG